MSIGSDVHDQTVRTAPFAPPASFPSEVIPLVLSLVDALVTLLSSLAGGLAYLSVVGKPLSGSLPFCAVGLLAGFIYVLRLNGRGYYDFAESTKPQVEVREILVCWFTTGLLLALIAFLLKVGVAYSRGSFFAFYFLAPVGLLGVRKATKMLLSSAVSRGAVGRRDVVLIGDIDEISALKSRDLLAFIGATDVTRFTLSRDDDPTGRTENDLRILNSAINFVRANNCREVLLALPWRDVDRIELIREQLRVLPAAARLLPDMRVRSLTNYSSSPRQRIPAFEIQWSPLSTTERLVKRAMDVTIASTALILLLPVMMLTAIAIKLDGRGPVIFRQRRKGFNGKQFVMFKFRTMTVQEDGAVVTQATHNDSRVTPIGRSLRATSIDELPQFLNVLRGDMSLIGPRPHALAHDNYFQDLINDYAFRHHVKPGITGWAQCNGLRGATPSIEHISERVKLDLWYINNWSLWLDIQILIRTFIEVLRKRNAY